MTIEKVLDIELINGGSVFMLRPITNEGLEWLLQQVDTEPWQWSCGCLAVDHHYILDLIDGATDDGLEIGAGT